jgi:3-dehydroquinate synthetase
MLALRTGRFSEAEHLRVLALLALAGLPLQTRLAPEAIVAAMRSDKKRRDGGARFVLPRAIGDVEYGIACNDRTVRAVLQALARAPESIRARR